MVNINQSENKNEELKLSPLGTDEINSVIKSFKNSTFNQEELYKKDDKKNFVKKTLFDLAKESERISSEENQSKTDNSSEENVGVSQEIVKDINQNDEPDNIHSFNDLDENNNNEKEEDHVDRAIDETIKSDEVSEENVNDKQEKSDEVLEENINKNVKELNEEIPDTNSAETNKIEYEEKTLEALDSVREAVTKSLEENIETQNEEIKNNTEDSKR